MKRLFFDSQRTIATAGLQLRGDDLVWLTIPATRFQLCEPDFHKDRQLQVLQKKHAVDEAFRLFSAIKRSEFCERSKTVEERNFRGHRLQKKISGFSARQTQLSKTLKHIITTYRPYDLQFV